MITRFTKEYKSDHSLSLSLSCNSHSKRFTSENISYTSTPNRQTTKTPMAKAQGNEIQFSVWQIDPTPESDEQSQSFDQNSQTNSKSKLNQWTNDLDQSDENYSKRQR